VTTRRIARRRRGDRLSEAALNDEVIRRGLLSALLEMSDDAIVGRSLDGAVMSWNQGAERLFGYTSAEVIGRPMAVILPDDRAEEATHLFERVRRGEVVKHLQSVRVRKDGSLVDVTVDAAPIRDDRGEIIGCTVVSHDIAERVLSERAVQSANEALRRADELKNTFLRTVSHDVRTPLTAVLSAAKLLEDDSELTEEQRVQFTRMIVRNSHKIRRLLDDVLDIERLTRGDGLAPICESVNVRAVVRSVIEEVNSSGRTIDVDCSVGTIFADRIQFERTLYNLIGNAIKHTDSEITVRTWRDDGGTVLAVDDAGPGVPEDLKQAIFEPFRRATDEHTPGTGVGLSLVAEFARAHGGRAWVEDRPGGGASFRVFFPDETKNA